MDIIIGAVTFKANQLKFSVQYLRTLTECSSSEVRVINLKKSSPPEETATDESALERVSIAFFRLPIRP